MLNFYDNISTRPSLGTVYDIFTNPYDFGQGLMDILYYQVEEEPSMAEQMQNHVQPNNQTNNAKPSEGITP